MKSKVKSPEDFGSGLLFIGFGILAVVVSRDYPIGTTSRMGPGYFPTVIGFILIILGLIIAATSLKVTGEGIGSFAWRPIILLSAAFSFYGWAIDHIGFIPALFGLIVLSAASGSKFKWSEVLIMSVGFITGTWLLFIWALKMPYPLFCWR